MTSQPSTNQSAYYDPSTNGIWYPKSSGGVVGRVVDGADGLGKLKGKRIRGEILEISDAPVEKISRDDRGEVSLCTYVFFVPYMRFLWWTSCCLVGWGVVCSFTHQNVILFNVMYCLTNKEAF
jgi:hypothetical protein